MAKVTFDYSKAESFISNDEVNSMKEIAENAKKVLVERTGAGNDFLGWIDLPVDYDKEEFDRIKKAAAKIQSDSEVLIVIGIGGSYLGARAAIEFLRHGFYNNVPKEVRKTPENRIIKSVLSRMASISRLAKRSFTFCVKAEGTQPFLRSIFQTATK